MSHQYRKKKENAPVSKKARIKAERVAFLLKTQQAFATSFLQQLLSPGMQRECWNSLSHMVNFTKLHDDTDCSNKIKKKCSKIIINLLAPQCDGKKKIVCGQPQTTYMWLNESSLWALHCYYPCDIKLPTRSAKEFVPTKPNGNRCFIYQATSRELLALTKLHTLSCCCNKSVRILNQAFCCNLLSFFFFSFVVKLHKCLLPAQCRHHDQCHIDVLKKKF